MQTQNTAIIGVGNVGKALFQGNSFEDSKNTMYLFRRSYWNDDLRNGSRDTPLKNFNNVIVAVKPLDAVNTLDLMRGEMHENSLLLSTVSTLSNRVMNEILGSDHSFTKTVKLTLNTAVATRNGIIVYTAANKEVGEQAEEIFKPLCRSVIKVNGSDINPYILIVGSSHGVNIKNLLIYWKAYYAGVPLQDFLEMINCKTECIAQYIGALQETYKKLWGINGDIATLSFESTVAHLMQSGCLTEQDLIHQIDLVATHKGCTRKLVDSYELPKQTNEKFFLEKLTDASKTVDGFEKIILKDFNALVKRRRQPAIRMKDVKSPYFAKMC
jgi:hypothetical protein